MTRVQELNSLREALEVIEQHSSLLEERHFFGPEDDLLAATSAVNAVLVFLVSMHWDEGIQRPLVRLQEALFNFRDGISSSWLRPKKRAGRAPIPDSIMAERGRAAAVQSMLMTAGFSKRDAATFVLRQLGHDVVGRLRWHDSRTPIGWRTVTRWRDDVIGVGGGGSDKRAHAARACYNWMEGQLKSRLETIEPQNAAREALHEMAREIKSFEAQPSLD